MTVTATRTRPAPDRMSRTWLTIARLAPAAFLAAVAPLVAGMVRGEPGAASELLRHSPDVLGKAALLTLLASYAITPLVTFTGRRGPVVLRRDFALWTCVFAFSDLLIAVALDPGGPMAGMAGHAGPAFGTLATLLLVPLAVTSNRLSMRLLGRDWKRLHRLIYPIFALVVLHLCFVGTPLFAVTYAAVTALLWAARTRRFRRWATRRRAARTARTGGG